MKRTNQQDKRQRMPQTSPQQSSSTNIGRTKIVLASLLLFTGTRIGLKLFGFRRTYGTLKRSASNKRGSREPESAASKKVLAKELTNAVQRANNTYALQDVNCLPESLTLWWLLRRRGIEADLRLGARKMGELFGAHAWVEYEGMVLNDTEDVRLIYVPFDFDP